jgi:hypothetical protein
MPTHSQAADQPAGGLTVEPDALGPGLREWFGSLGDYRAASPATVPVWVVPHAGHTQGLATAPRAWEARVIGFLDAALKP